jgi:serine/threonine protein kinase
MKNTTAPKHSKQTAAARKYEAECEAKRLRVRKYVNRLTAYAPSEWGESCSSTGARLTFRATMILHRIDDSMIGTPDYMSPEQARGEPVDGRSDLYSLGVMLFQMLTGVLPFRGESMAELMFKIANEEAPDIRMIRKELPESLANLVALSVSKRPETRYQDGDQFAADLRSVMNEMGGGAPATQPVMAAPVAAPAATSAGHDKTAVFATAAVAASASANSIFDNEAWV